MTHWVGSQTSRIALAPPSTPGTAASLLRLADPIPSSTLCGDLRDRVTGRPDLPVLPVAGDGGDGSGGLWLLDRAVFLAGFDRPAGSPEQRRRTVAGLTASEGLSRRPLSVDLATPLYEIGERLAGAGPDAPGTGFIITGGGTCVGIGTAADLLGPLAAEARQGRRLLDTALAGIVRTTRDGRFLSANPAFAHMLGYDSPEQLLAEVTDIGRQIHVDPTARADFVDRIERDGEVLHLESQVRRRDGAVLWVSESSRVVRDADGRVLYYEGVVADVTDRTGYELQLARKQVALQATLEAMEQGVLMTDAEGGVIAHNTRLLDLFGLPPDLLLEGTPYRALLRWRAEHGEYGPGDPDAIVERLLAETRQGPPAVLEFVRPDGHTIEARNVSLPGGGFVQTAADITARKRIADELNASRRMLHAVIDAIPAVVNVKDLNGRFLLMNRFQADVHDLMPEAAVGRTAEELFGRAEAPEADLASRAGIPGNESLERTVIETGEALPFYDETIAAPSGEPRHWLSTKVPLKDAGGAVSQIVTVSLDVTALKRTEGALQQERATLRATLENMDQAVLMIDSDLRVFGWNLRCVDLLGLPHRLLERHPTMDQIAQWHAEHGEYDGAPSPQGLSVAGLSAAGLSAASLSAAGLSADVQEQVQFWTGQRSILENWPIYERRRPDGTVIEVRTNRLPDHGFVCTYTDITERVEAEDLARRHRENVRGLLDASPVGVGIMARDGAIVWSNTRLAGLLGYSGKEMLRMRMRMQDWLIDPALGTRLLGMLDEAEPVRDVEAECRRADGTHGWMLMSLDRMEFDDQPGIIGWVYDITARRHAEEALRSAQESLVQAEKMAALGSLVAGIAHEINTPIGTVLTASSHLGERTAILTRILDAGMVKKSDVVGYIRLAAEATAIIVTNIERASALIQGFKQVAVDQSSDERRRFNLCDYIGEVLVSLRPRLKKGLHTIEVDCPPAALEVDSYPGALSQVLTNLVVNALVHAFPEGQAGHITIRVRRPHPDDVELRFQDDGRGIPPQNLPRLFEPFFTTRRGAGGTGLGLHIVYNIVTRQLGGSIHALSAEGRGATFIIRFPRVAARAVTDDEHGQQNRPNGTGVD